MLRTLNNSSRSASPGASGAAPGPGSARPATFASLGMVTEPSRFNSAGMIFTDAFDDDWLRENWTLAMGDFDVY